MSARQLFGDNSVDYLLPTVVGAAAGSIISLTPVGSGNGAQSSFAQTTATATFACSLGGGAASNIALQFISTGTIVDVFLVNAAAFTVTADAAGNGTLTHAGQLPTPFALPAGTAAAVLGTLTFTGEDATQVTAVVRMLPFTEGAVVIQLDTNIAAFTAQAYTFTAYGATPNSVFLGTYLNTAPPVVSA